MGSRFFEDVSVFAWFFLRPSSSIELASSRKSFRCVSHWGHPPRSWFRMKIHGVWKASKWGFSKRKICCGRCQQVASQVFPWWCKKCPGGPSLQTDSQGAINCGMSRPNTLNSRCVFYGIFILFIIRIYLIYRIACSNGWGGDGSFCFHSIVILAFFSRKQIRCERFVARLHGRNVEKNDVRHSGRWRFLRFFWRQKSVD